MLQTFNMLKYIMYLLCIIKLYISQIVQETLYTFRSVQFQTWYVTYMYPQLPIVLIVI